MSNGYPAHNFLRPDNFNGFGGEGILTLCASATPFGLALAPD